jgi:hypothetical protein
MLKRMLRRADNHSMSVEPDPLCFTCGLAFDGRHFNRLKNGAVCPTCRDRLLDTLPAPLPRGMASGAEVPVGANVRPGALHVLRAIRADEPKDS